jgi:hypothetical protein
MASGPAQSVQVAFTETEPAPTARARRSIEPQPPPRSGRAQAPRRRRHRRTLPATKTTGDYILRAETALLIPMWEALSLKFSVINNYDSTPAEDTDENSLSTLMGLSYGF